jgi:hypothetical protein
MKSRWVIKDIKTREQQLRQELLDETAIRKGVRQALSEDPELRARVKRLAQQRLEQPREVGGGAGAVIVERADGSTRRVDLGTQDPREVTKEEGRASFRDVLAAPVWDGTRYVAKS